MTIREEIDAQFPIRKTTAQKRAFEKWVMAKMREMGYRPYVDGMNRKDKLRHRNIVAGDPQNAELLISAHYDTAATIGVPDLRIPRNFPVYILAQGAVLLGMLLISLLIGTVVGLATKSGDLLILTFFFAYLALMLLMMFGAANKHNVNDNTSGIAALLETMQRLSPEAREKTAFILFDHQETGSRGAKSYGAQHVEVQTMKLLVDLNCVGDGDTFVISAPKMAQEKPEYAAVRESLEENGIRRVDAVLRARGCARRGRLSALRVRGGRIGIPPQRGGGTHHRAHPHFPRYRLPTGKFGLSRQKSRRRDSKNE